MDKYFIHIHNTKNQYFHHNINDDNVDDEGDVSDDGSDARKDDDDGMNTCSDFGDDGGSDDGMMQLIVEMKPCLKRENSILKMMDLTVMNIAVDKYFESDISQILFDTLHKVIKKIKRME